MKYLLSKYGGDKRELLYPSDVRTRAVVDQCMFFNAGVFFAAFMSVGVSETHNLKEDWNVLRIFTSI